jgi:uncharacterized protein
MGVHMATLPASEGQSERIVALDVIRGIAVMGIFSVNVVGMAMIQSAYFYPPAFGFEHLTDRLMWFVNFVLVDGKMRSLFSMLFGASTLLVMDAAIRSGRSPWVTHYARMIVLLGLGFLHFFVLWWGDILTHYAAVGMVAVLLSKLRARILLGLAVFGFLLYAAPGAYFFPKMMAEREAAHRPGAPAQLRATWAERERGLAPDRKAIEKDRAEHSSIPAHFRAAADKGWKAPLDLGPLWIETLALMLLGMAGYKSGFLTGQWTDRKYRRVAAICLGGGLAVFAALGVWAWMSDFQPPRFFLANQVISPPLRPVTAIGYAALIILLFRNRSALRDRFAAVGRTAFSNYLACTIIGTFVFYGFAGDLYARLSRSEAWLLVPVVWALMLLWSKPWLERFNYGPFEWLWRSLARGRIQPMRKRPPQAEAVPVSA